MSSQEGDLMTMNIKVSEDTIKIIETFTGMSVEAFLDKTREDLLNKYQEGNRITVEEAAKIMGVSKLFVRAGLRDGTLPFGTAAKMSSKWTFYISPKKFYEYVGYSHKLDQKNGG